jgi:hypothetical protein
MRIIDRQGAVAITAIALAAQIGPQTGWAGHAMSQQSIFLPSPKLNAMGLRP